MVFCGKMSPHENVLQALLELFGHKVWGRGESVQNRLLNALKHILVIYY